MALLHQQWFVCPYFVLRTVCEHILQYKLESPGQVELDQIVQRHEIVKILFDKYLKLNMGRLKLCHVQFN